MKKYIVKLLPCYDQYYKTIREKDWIWNGTSICMCTAINYQEKTLKCSAFLDWTDIKNWTKLTRYLCSTDDIKEGDEVSVVYTDGAMVNPREIPTFITGTLTRKWNVDEGPYCMIDGKNVDLAGEGHSSNVYKRICVIDCYEWAKDGLELSEDEVELEGFYDTKKQSIWPTCKKF
jgi:hypothetical protein